MNADRVTLDEREVMIVAHPGDAPEAAKPAWEALEAALGSLRGRQFYGYYDPPRDRYVACVVRNEDDDPELLGLETDTLPGGVYVRARLRGEPPGVYAEIGPTFDALAAEHEPERDRPWLEHYRRRDEIDVLLPVAD